MRDWWAQAGGPSEAVSTDQPLGHVAWQARPEADGGGLNFRGQFVNKSFLRLRSRGQGGHWSGATSSCGCLQGRD